VLGSWLRFPRSGARKLKEPRLRVIVHGLWQPDSAERVETGMAGVAGLAAFSTSQLGGGKAVPAGCFALLIDGHSQASPSRGPRLDAIVCCNLKVARFWGRSSHRVIAAKAPWWREGTIVLRNTGASAEKNCEAVVATREATCLSSNGDQHDRDFWETDDQGS
jgi:hypothetical protein